MTNDLISRDALIKAVEDMYEYAELDEVIDVIKKAPSVTPSLILDNITEDDIKKFRLICQRANGKGVCIIYEERGAEDGKAESADRC